MGKGKSTGGREGRAVESTCHDRDQHICPACVLGVCQLDVSVTFTDEEAEVLKSQDACKRSHIEKTAGLKQLHSP